MNKKPIKLVNPLNQETWLCDDYSNVKLVEDVEYVTVYKPDNPKRSYLMRKEALRKSSNT